MAQASAEALADAPRLTDAPTAHDRCIVTILYVGQRVRVPPGGRRGMWWHWQGHARPRTPRAPAGRGCGLPLARPRLYTAPAGRGCGLPLSRPRLYTPHLQAEVVTVLVEGDGCAVAALHEGSGDVGKKVERRAHHPTRPI